jgi:hypothetical protein
MTECHYFKSISSQEAKEVSSLTVLVRENLEVAGLGHQSLKARVPEKKELKATST